MKIDGRTRLYGIIGNPVSHSLSPAMHNAAFAALRENRVYLPFAVDDVEAALQGLRGLGIDGASVTIPHKEAVMAHLDHVDEVARRIGAVNTITCERRQGRTRLCGYNTDWLGAIRPLRRHVELRGAKAVILGAGGSARAIGFGLLEEGAALTLCSRTESRGRRLADDLGCGWCGIEQVETLEGQILINATPVGMVPQHRLTPVPRQVLANFEVVMDIVYAPPLTRLLDEAQQQGCRTVNGLEMLLYQGVAQFELWTGLQAPVAVMRQVLQQAVAARH